MQSWLKLLEARDSCLQNYSAERLLCATEEAAPFTFDRYGTHYLLTWTSGIENKSLTRSLIPWLQSRGARSLTSLIRKKTGRSAFELEWGEGPREAFLVYERDLCFRVSLHEGQQSGLFLDHAALRLWLQTHLKATQVLNLFGYTGSLSVAAAIGRNTHVTTVDLSSKSLQHASQNLTLNGVTSYSLIQRDALTYLKQCKKKQLSFDCVILDPPTFSRDKRGKIHRTDDPVELFQASLEQVRKGGIWIVSVNTSTISRKQFNTFCLRAIKNRTFMSLKSLEAEVPVFGKERPDYLKGMIFQLW